MTDYTTMTNDELSAEIAKRLFNSGGDWSKRHYWLEPYASDHNAAMGLVVPEMRKRGCECYLNTHNKGWVAFFTGVNRVNRRGDDQEIPRAICLAALAALDAEEGK